MTERRSAPHSPGSARPGGRGRSGVPPRPGGPASRARALGASLLVCLAASAPASAQALPPDPAGDVPGSAAVSRDTAPDRMDLREVVVRALARSAGAEAASRRREAAGHGATAGGRPPNPTLEAEGPDAEGVAELQLRQPLRLFGQGDAVRRLGRAERTLADRRLRTERASLARETARLYLKAVAARRELAVTEAILRLRRAAAERLEGVRRRGWESRRSVHGARMDVRAAVRQVEALRAASRRHRQRLRRRLGVPADDTLRLAGTLAGDAGRSPSPPVPEELPEDAPEVAEARAAVGAAEARLGRIRTRTRPVPAVGPMVSLGDGVDPGIALELDLPLWDRNRAGTLAARSRVAASEAEARQARRSARAEYADLLGRRDAVRNRLDRLRSDELEPAREEVRRRSDARELGLPVAAARRRARSRSLRLRREEARLQRELSLLEVDAAWRSGSLLAWLREPGSASGGGANR